MCGASWPFSISWTYEQVIEHLHKGVEFEIKQVVFSGGEVTLRKDLPLLLAHAKRMNYENVIVLTNGRKLSSTSYLGKLIESGITGIGTTLYSLFPEVHEKITGVQGSFFQTVAGIRTVSAYRPNIPFSVNIVITLENYQSLSETVQYLIDLGVRSIQITYVVPIGRAKGIFKSGMPLISEILPLLEKSINLFEKAIDKSNHYSITTSFFPRCMLGNLGSYATDEDPSLTYFVSPDKTMISLKELLGKDMLVSKTNKCENCLDSYHCIGLWREYTNVHGWDELKAIQ